MKIHPVAFIRFSALLALLFAIAGCEKTPAPEPAPTVVESAARPRLIFSAADIPAIKEKAGKGWLKDAHATMMAQADAAAANPVLSYGGEGSENWTLKSFYALGLAGQMTGDLKYAQGGAKTLLALVRQMDPDADFETHPETGFKKILQIGTMATVVALGYDFFHTALTPEERQEVEAEIRQYGACIYRRANAEIWGKDDRLHLVHNWTGVIFPGLGLCALALDEHPEWLELATLRVKQHFDHCVDAKGATWESVAYMDYGLMNAAPFAEALRRKTGRDLVAESAQVQNLLKHIVTIQYPWKAGMVAFNQGGDATLGMCDHGGFVYLLSRTRDAAAFHAWSHLMGFAFPPGKLTPYSLDTSNLGALVLWGDPAMPTQSPQEAGCPLTTHYEERGLAVLRDGWGEDDALATLIAGEGVHGCWNHADNNSFTFTARGEMFAIDRGSFTRVNGKKIPKREPWDHNVVLVDGMGYKFVKGSQSVPGKLVSVKDLGGSALATGDVKTAFAGPFEKAERSVFLVRGPQPVLIVVDDIQKDAAEHEFTWLMHTGLENKIEVDVPASSARITGSRKGGVCDVRVLWPKNAAVSQIEARDQSDNAIIAATARAVNPRFVTVLTARAANEKAVAVAAEGDPETGMTLRLTYADGSVKSITVKQENISLKTVDENHPQISFALERLNTALASTGAKATTREADLKPGDFLVTLADDASQVAAESGSYVIRTRPDGTHLVLGRDATGALYGCLHAARLAAGGQAAFDVIESPVFRYRGVAVPLQLMELIYDGVFYDYPITRENFPFFYDQAHWTRVLDMLVENRMNVLYLWNGHPFTSLLPMDKYPDAREVSPEQLEQNMAMYGWLTREAEKRGIWVVQLFYNIHISHPLAKKMGIPFQGAGITPFTKEYTRYCVGEFVKTYPHVGLLMTLGEAMAESDGPEWLNETILPGVKDGMAAAGLTEEPPVIVRAHATRIVEAITRAKKQYGNILTMHKWNGESLTWDNVRGPVRELHTKLATLGGGHVINVHLLSNLEPFRWGSPTFIRSAMTNAREIGASGLHLYPLYN